MKRELKKLSITTLFHLFSFLNFFIKNKHITKKKLIYGALIVGLTASVSSCHRHRHTCYSVRFLDNVEINDSTKTTANIK